MGIAARLSALLEGVRIAFDSIRVNKVRAGLTILGIAVGVFVVTAMSAAVHGINAGVTSSLAAAGPNTFFITKWPMQMNSCTGSDDSCPWRRNAPLTLRESEAISRLPAVARVTAHVGSSVAIKYKDRDLPSVSLDGYTPRWMEVTAGDIAPGRSFTDEENESASLVVIVNDKVVERLFGESDPIGKVVFMQGQPFRVIGVYRTTGNVFESGGSGKVIVPIETARRRLNVGVRWLDLTVKPRDEVAQDRAIDDVVAALRAGRGLRPAQENTFFVSTQEKILELYNKIVGVFFLVMLVLGSIGLIVGGVGVVAIMMISVTERTREIGIRKALGATRRIILWQFLVEAATLTTVGATAGLMVGGLLTWAIRTYSPIDASIPPLAIVAALVASAFTGVLFGLLPAIRAARLDPVEALRFE
ncbi:MAG: ABC transporter permease [Gemmatimonadaceae bacterium]|nr:ABC transporter permease [Gemmatimonadaceae bacterium]MDQ3520214.1 ABC transporter permease [Gemmatimonadota bacterium]